MANKITEYIAKHRLKERFIAWWEGYYLLPDGTRAQFTSVRVSNHDEQKEDAAGAPANKPAAKPKPVWDGDRYTLLEQMWGAGNAGPAGDVYHQSLYSVFGLTSSNSVLDIGDGMAEAACFMAHEYGAYVETYISNPDYQKKAEEHIKNRKVVKNVKVVPYDPDNFDVLKKYDCTVTHKILWRVPDLRAFLQTITQHLKRPGHVCLVDYMADADLLATPDGQRWFAEEHYKHGVTVQQLETILTELKYDIRIVENQTKQHMLEIKKALAGISAFMQTVQPTPAAIEAVAHEVERWSLRYRLLASGLTLHRIYAIKPPD